LVRIKRGKERRIHVRLREKGKEEEGQEAPSLQLVEVVTLKNKQTNNKNVTLFFSNSF
jgi:hypothetical protein